MRQQAKDHGPGKHGKKYWWQHTLRADPLYQSIAGLDRCLVVPITSAQFVFAFQPIDQVFALSLRVFATSNFSPFAVLQSRIHEPWVRLLSSKMGSAGIRYSGTDCFDNFPFPDADPRVSTPDLELAGENLYNARAAFMREGDQGLTSAYNAMRNQECDDDSVLELRRLTEEMDRAVLDAYGWGDIEVPSYCPMNPEEEGALEAFSDEVVDRLYVLNAERAAEEARQEPSQKPIKKRASKRSKKKADGTMMLPGMSDPEGAS